MLQERLERPGADHSGLIDDEDCAVVETAPVLVDVEVQDRDRCGTDPRAALQFVRGRC